MKDFQDFIETIDSEEYETIMFSANQAMIVTGKNDSHALSYFVALELLQRYHNWISND